MDVLILVVLVSLILVALVSVLMCVTFRRGVQAGRYQYEQEEYVGRQRMMRIMQASRGEKP